MTTENRLTMQSALAFLIAAAVAEVAAMVAKDGLGAVTKEYRRAKVAELRAVPCTLGEIGTVFGLTPERVRTIELEAKRAGQPGR